MKLNFLGLQLPVPITCPSFRMTWLRLRVGNCLLVAAKRKSVSHKMRFDIIAATFFFGPLAAATCQLPFFSVAIAFFGHPVHSSALIKDCAIRATCFQLIYAAGVMAYQWLVVCRPLDRFITIADTQSLTSVMPIWQGGKNRLSEWQAEVVGQQRAHQASFSP